MAQTLTKAVKIFLATLIFYALTAVNPGWSKQAQQADKLVETAGINTHFGYNNTAYFGNDYEGRLGQDILEERLIELGVRHIRDNLQGGGHHYSFLNDLAGVRTQQQPQGIKTLAVARDWEDKPIDFIVSSEVAEARSLFSQSHQPLEAFEVRNEQDTYGEENWATRVVLLQKAFYEAIARDPQMSALPVLGPSFSQLRGGPVAEDSPILFNASRLGINLFEYMDFGNLHSYSGYLGDTRRVCRPEVLCAFSSEPYEHLEALDSYRRLSGDRPFYVTETGYSQSWPNRPPYLSESDIARMIPRALVDQFSRGIQRVYFYQLADDPEGFAFLNDDYSRRQQFVALRNTLHLLSDPGDDFEPGSLAYSLSGETDRVRDVLLQKRDGKFYLLLWQAVGRAENQNREDNPRRSVSVKLDGQQFSSLKVYEPTFDDSVETPTVRDEATNGNEKTIMVSDHLAVLEITLKAED